MLIGQMHLTPAIRPPALGRGRGLQSHGKLVTAALEHDRRRDRVDYAEVNVERRALRERRQAPKELRGPGSTIVGIDRLRSQTLPEREPRRARTVVVDR